MLSTSIGLDKENASKALRSLASFTPFVLNPCFALTLIS